MRKADIEHDADGGRRHAGQLADFAGTRHGVLHDQHPITRIHLENRHRDTGVSVEVALTLVHPLPASQKMGDQVLRRGLSGTPGDRHDGKGAAAKPFGGHVEEGLAGIVDEDYGGPIGPLRWPLAKHAGGAALDRLRNEDVPIVMLPPERHEEPTRFDFARVGEDMIRVGIIGVGKMGISHYAIFNAQPDVKVAAVCDTSGFILSTLKKNGTLKKLAAKQQIPAGDVK